MIVDTTVFPTGLKRIARFIEFYSFPSSVVVILIVGEIHPVPFPPIEDQVPSCLMIGIDQFRKLPHTRIHKETVGLRQSAQVLHRMNLILIVKAFTFKSQGKIKIKFITRRIVIIQIHSNRYPVGTSLRLCHAPSHSLICRSMSGRIHYANRHFGQSVLIRVIKEKRILPIQPQIFE